MAGELLFLFVFGRCEQQHVALRWPRVSALDLHVLEFCGPREWGLLCRPVAGGAWG